MSDVTIESLELEITSNSKNAVKGIDALTQSLNKLKTATKGGLGLSKVAKETEKIAKSTRKMASENKKATVSFTDLYNKMKVGMTTIKNVVDTIYSAVKKSSDYVENVNLFTVSMGEYADSAKEYAESVGEVMGIDPGEWMRNQGVFMTLATGFGVASDRAALMSQNLTQLGYDLSSFFNISYEDAMEKLQSGLSGELEPLRRIGYDLSQAKLEATALELGIDKSVSSMTQAEKAQLRYYAIMTQVTTAHGDMARTLDAPANQLKVLKAQFNMAAREIGNVFIPMLNAVLPYGIAILKVIRSLASSIASLVGYEIPEFDYSGVSAMGDSAIDTNDAMEDATESAKKLKSYMLGFDELNVINPNEGSSSGVEDALGGFDFELPTYKFIEEEVDSKVAQIVEDMKEWLGITEDIDSWSDLLSTKFGDILQKVGLIGAGLLLWKLSAPFLGSLTALTTSLGLMLLIDSVIVTLKEGLSWQSAVEGAIGGALIGAGLGFKFGGWQSAIGGIVIGIGVSLLINGITSMISEGLTVENFITTAIANALIGGALGVKLAGGGLGAALGVFVGISVTLLITGITGMLDGDVSVEDVISLITGVLGTITGLVTIIKLFNAKNGTPIKHFDDAGKNIADIDSGTSALTSKLKGLAKNLGLGLAIIAEVAAAAVLIVGAIWLLGVELEQVGIAWQPVIDNGATVAIAIGIGTGLLVGIGAATAAIGTLGGGMAGQIGIGIAILAELGVATILFVAEILAIGVLLDEVGQAWQPVLDNGETIKTGIVTGTALLVAIGVVTAALGMATVATAGALPLAIGLGTAILVELSVAFVLFIESLVDVANKLKDDLHPALDELNTILPDLSIEMENFISFMTTFADLVVDYTKVSSISGIASTVDTIVGFFTQDPIKKMAKDVDKQADHFDDLIKSLEKAIPKIQRAIELTIEYNAKMAEYSRVSSGSTSSKSDSSGGVLGKLVDGVGSLFRQGVSVSIPAYASGGFPEQGQIFIAREASAEMVGSIGRRTAVANNDQIVSGIAGGVAEANEEQNTLLREQNSLLRAMLEKDSGVYLDGKNLANSVEKYQRERGRVLIAGGVV